MSYKSLLFLGCLVGAVLIASHVNADQPPTPATSKPVLVGKVPVADILKRLGAKLEQGTPGRELDHYSSQFDREDRNRDGKHSRQEYVEQGRYLTPQARSGIFRAADGNSDGVVTKDEYILNRIITDEAKIIVQRMDDDRDTYVERAEFIKHATKLFSDPKLATTCYAALDRNNDGEITIPEYLQVWGKWARAGRETAEKRIAARRAALAKPAKPTKPTPPTPDKPKEPRRDP